MKQGTEYNRNYRASLPPSRRRPSPPQLYSSAHRRGRAYVTLPTSRPSRGPGPPRHNTSKHGSVCTQRGVQKDSRTRSAMRYRSAPRCWGRCCADLTAGVTYTNATVHADTHMSAQQPCRNTQTIAPSRGKMWITPPPSPQIEPTPPLATAVCQPTAAVRAQPRGSCLPRPCRRCSRSRGRPCRPAVRTSSPPCCPRSSPRTLWHRSRPWRPPG